MSEHSDPKQDKIIKTKQHDNPTSALFCNENHLFYIPLNLY